MKLLVIFGAVLLSAVTGKVLPNSNPDSTTVVTTVQIPLQTPNSNVNPPNSVEEAHVVEVQPANPHTVSSTTAPEVSSVISVMSNDVKDTTKAVEKRSLIPTTKKMLMLDRHNPCDVLCTKFELNPVCATNGICVHEFPNQCVLDTYNCEHPEMHFRAVRIERCEHNSKERCDESDLKVHALQATIKE